MVQKTMPRTVKPATKKAAAKPQSKAKAPVRPASPPKSAKVSTASKYDQSGAPWWKKFRPE